MFLHLMEIVPLGAEVELESLPRETAPPVVMPDSALRVKLPGQRAFIFHTEIERNFRRSKLPSVALYGVGLVTQYRMPVKTTVLLLGRKGNPDFDHGMAEFSIEGTRLLHPYRLVRLWEMDPAPLLNAADPGLLPWATMMNSTDQEVRKIGKELGGLGNEELLARFYLLAGVRYDRDQLEEMTGERHMGIMEFLWENSSVLVELKDRVAAEGKAEGRAEGRAEGKTEEARRLLKSVLATKFPGLEAAPQLAKLDNVKTIELLLIQVVGTTDHAAAKQAILKAARHVAT